MYLLSRFTLDSAHCINDTPDLFTKKCASFHGHRYDCEIRFNLEMLKHLYGKNFIDFELIRRDFITLIMNRYDHVDLTIYHIHTVEDLAENIKEKCLDIIKRFYGTMYDSAMSTYATPVTVTIFETSKWGVEC